MTQEEKNKLLENLNQMIELSNKSIIAWVNLMKQGKYPIEYCLEHISLKNKQKEVYFSMMQNYL